MTRILVTGATGCVGRHVLPLLVGRGYEIHAVSSRGTPEGVPTQVHWHRTDLRHGESARQLVASVEADALLHLAWFVAPGRWAEAEENLDWVTATIDLVRAFAAAGGRRVVVAGSCLEYDWNYGYCSEARTPCVPHTLYGAAKHATRLLLERYAATAGLSLAWARIFFLYGPHEHPARLVPSVVRAILRGEIARCSHGQQVRDYLFAGDVADALVRLLEADVVGPLNIASGQPISLRALATRAGELLDGKGLLQFGAIPAAPTDTPIVVGDVSRLTQALQWRPTHTLDQGLQTTIEWWRQRLHHETCEVR